MHGDALDMPFDSNTFDVVMSRTFLTNIHDPSRALKEMMRIGKSGGKIAFVTAESFQNIPEYGEDYPSSHEYHEEWLEEFCLQKDRRERYLQLLEERRDTLLRDAGENYIWEWCGGSNLCMTAVILPKMLTVGTFMR